MARPFYTNIDLLNVSRVVGLAAPTAADHAANKAYVDSAIEGIAWKDSVRVSTVSNINLASPGGTIDGITMATSDRVLVMAQTAGSENGIYIWNGSSTPMTRSDDTSTAAELEQAVTTVEEGTNAGASYRQSAVNFTLGSGTVTWTAFGTSIGAASESSAGVIEIATTSETNTGTDDNRAVTPKKLAEFTGFMKQYSTLVGDGSATQYTLTHNLGKRNVLVDVYRNSGNYDTVECDVERLTTNTVRLTFASAPSSNQFGAVIAG